MIQIAVIALFIQEKFVLICICQDGSSREKWQSTHEKTETRSSMSDCKYSKWSSDHRPSHRCLNDNTKLRYVVRDEHMKHRKMDCCRHFVVPLKVRLTDEDVDNQLTRDNDDLLSFRHRRRFVYVLPSTPAHVTRMYVESFLLTKFSVLLIATTTTTSKNSRHKKYLYNLQPSTMWLGKKWKQRFFVENHVQILPKSIITSKIN